MNILDQFRSHRNKGQEISKEFFLCLSIKDECLQSALSPTQTIKEENQLFFIPNN